MKFSVYFKTPDALDYAIEHMDEEEQIQARDFAGKFIEYGECITVEFDTEEGTATVIE